MTWTDRAFCYEGCGRFFTSVGETAQEAENKTKAQILAHVEEDHE